MSTTTENVTELYLATFGRAPDFTGLTYWSNNINAKGWSLQMVARSFFDQTEAQVAYPASLSISDFIDQVYENVLERAPDASGKDYWTRQLNTGVVPRNDFIIAIINGAKAGTSASDQELLANKSAVGVYFSSVLQIDDTTLATNIMQQVTSATTSVERAKSDLASYKTNFLSGSILTTLTDYSNTFSGTSSKDWLFAGDGNDVIYTGDGKSMIYGESGDDRLYGGAAQDTLHGGVGADSLYGDGEDDMLYGDADSDSLHGDAGDDTLWGDEGDDYLYGGDDNDTLWGGEGNDNISAEDGDDFVYGESGDDWIELGDGSNWADGGSGDDMIVGGAGIDQIFGGEGADEISGAGGNDILDGKDGDDDLYGGLGDDLLYGGAGNDILYGNAGNDVLKGEAGDDTLYGGAGADTVSGGSGNDTFVFAVGDSTTASMDVIMDFSFSVNGADKLGFVNFGSESIHANAVSVSAAATLADALATVTSGNDSDGVNAEVSWFVYQDNTYVYEDMTVGAYSSSGDIIAELLGIKNLAGLDSDSFSFM